MHINDPHVGHLNGAGVRTSVSTKNIVTWKLAISLRQFGHISMKSSGLSSGDNFPRKRPENPAIIATGHRTLIKSLTITNTVITDSVD
jgi:hypothetical protein